MTKRTSDRAGASDALEQRLTEAEHTLEAIRAGAVDAVVVEGEEGPQIFSLESPDQPFKTFVESMQEGAMTLSESGRILYSNPFFCELLGMSSEALLGTSFASLVPDEYRYTMDELLRQSLSKTVNGSVRVNAAQGPIPVYLTLSPLSGSQAPTSCMLASDLRDRERSEQARAARQAAEEANAAKDQFLAILSHELRSPLNTILGWAQILSGDETLTSATRKALATIERNARAQARLISDLLDISRIVAGKLALEMETVDLRQIVLAAHSAGRLNLSKSLTIEAHVPDAEVWVAGDRTRIEQVLNNLVHNAVKFTQEGGSILVSLEASGGRAYISVTDDGLGLAADEQAIVFDMFRQVSGSVRRSHGGLGLGLAIAKQLVEAHGGTLTVSSEGHGRGATFTLDVPLSSAPLAHARAAAQATRLDDVCVLVVDDDPDIVEFTCDLLVRHGARTVSAQSSTGALRAVAKAEPGSIHALVSDIGLPEQDGYALVRELRARGVHERMLPAIAVTGFASSHYGELARVSGYQAHLSKPVEASKLVTTVRAVVDRARTGGP